MIQGALGGSQLLEAPTLPPFSRNRSLFAGPERWCIHPPSCLFKTPSNLVKTPLVCLRSAQASKPAGRSIAQRAASR
eukprot:321615-Prorocentrum_minimum.AAC.2